jgi:hypothetical protein
MPVSPQDFALWSRMTGNPYPQTPAERMALAPEVYSYTRQIGRQGGPTMGPVRRAVDVAGKFALGAGLIAGAGYLASRGFQKLDLDNEPDIVSTVAEAVPDSYSQVSRASGDVTPPTTSDYYNQDVVPHQTAAVQSLRGTTAQKPTLGPIEQKPANQSEVIGSQQYFTPGTEEQQLSGAAQPSPSIRDQAEELIGRVSASQVAKFRQSPSYAATVKPLDSEELIGGVSSYEEPQTQAAVIPAEVRVTPATRTAVVKQESPIAEMSSVSAPQPVVVAAPQRKTAEQMEDERLARMAFGNMPIEKATALLAAARASKSGSTVAAPSELPATVVTPRQPEAIRVSSEVSAPAPRISPNEFLSAMSQQAGPVATYEIPSERSKAVRGLAFYPGGEIGVQMGKRKGGPTEYAYATADPYRLALSDYAEEGFPGGMGNIGGIVADKALAHQMGLQQSVEKGGGIRQKRQPVYAGLMSEADIASAGMGKSGSTRARAVEQAERHFETRNIMQELEARAAQRRAAVV